MINVILVRKLTCASNRALDLWFAKSVSYPAVPQAGNIIQLTGIGQAEVEFVMFNDDPEISDKVYVNLKGDHRTFKAAEQNRRNPSEIPPNAAGRKFTELSSQYVVAGWSPQTKKP